MWAWQYCPLVSLPISLRLSITQLDFSKLGWSLLLWVFASGWNCLILLSEVSLKLASAVPSGLAREKIVFSACGDELLWFFIWNVLNMETAGMKLFNYETLSQRRSWKEKMKEAGLFCIIMYRDHTVVFTVWDGQALHQTENESQKIFKSRVPLSSSR